MSFKGYPEHEAKLWSEVEKATCQGLVRYYSDYGSITIETEDVKAWLDTTEDTPWRIVQK